MVAVLWNRPSQKEDLIAASLYKTRSSGNASSLIERYSTRDRMCGCCHQGRSRNSPAQSQHKHKRATSPVCRFRAKIKYAKYSMRLWISFLFPCFSD